MSPTVGGSCNAKRVESETTCLPLYTAKRLEYKTNCLIL